jgi:DNA-directed RNA polymerase II subunit RPB11
MRLYRSLLRDKRVLFAGYQIHHPLFFEVKFKVRTTPETNPISAFESAISSCTSELTNIETNFEKALQKFKRENPNCETKDSMEVDV